MSEPTQPYPIPHTQQDDSASEIESRVLEDLADIVGRAAVAELIETFLLGLRQQLSTFEESLAKSELSMTERSVHSLKSAARYLGASELSELCNSIEVSAHAGDIDAIATRRSEFRERLLRVEQALRTIQAYYAPPA